MSTVRRQASGFLGKGPNGRNLCFCGCGREAPKGRINWYSQECVDRWNERNDPATIRRKLLARDHGICALCGVDCIAMQKSVEHRAFPIKEPDADDIAVEMGYERAEELSYHNGLQRYTHPDVMEANNAAYRAWYAKRNVWEAWRHDEHQRLISLG